LQEVRTKAIKIDNNTEITLIDTPGQEIFYRMRSSGAEVATFGLLLISMTDGVCFNFPSKTMIMYFTIDLPANTREHWDLGRIK
jgi:signal recognition particle receptor subunit beta